VRVARVRSLPPLPPPVPISLGRQERRGRLRMRGLGKARCHQKGARFVAAAGGDGALSGHHPRPYRARRHRHCNPPPFSHRSAATPPPPASLAPALPLSPRHSDAVPPLRSSPAIRWLVSTGFVTVLACYGLDHPSRCKSGCPRPTPSSTCALHRTQDWKGRADCREDHRVDRGALVPANFKIVNIRRAHHCPCGVGGEDGEPKVVRRPSHVLGAWCAVGAAPGVPSSKPHLRRHHLCRRGRRWS